MELYDKNGKPILDNSGNPIINEEVLDFAARKLRHALAKGKKEQPIYVINPNGTYTICTTKEEAAQKVEADIIQIENAIHHRGGVINGHVLLYASSIEKSNKISSPASGKNGKIETDTAVIDAAIQRLKKALAKERLEKKDTLYM